MLQRVTIEGVEFPRLYIAENDRDVRLARDNGLPYIKWKLGMEQLVRQLLRPTLEKMFPGISWNRVLGKRRPVKSNVVLVEGSKYQGEPQEIADYDKNAMLEEQLKHDAKSELRFFGNEPYERTVDIAESDRDCVGGESLDYSYFFEDHVRIEDYVGDLSASVDIDALMKLGLLPKFVGDIANCIKLNLSNRMRWTEGYTKKLGAVLGNFKENGVLPNLVIIDVSHSIPDGIAATMLTLADTLREQCNAELIITAGRSGYYPIGSELPSPQTLREYYYRSNESREFMAILAKHIAGREFGHVICFGDNDNPGSLANHQVDMTGTKVHAVHHYVTKSHCNSAGYARWVKECCPNAAVEVDSSWCSVMSTTYRM